MLKLILCAGFLGPILMYVGDMLLYGTNKKIPSVLDGKYGQIKFLLGQSSSRRIFWGGLIGPAAEALSILGSFHIPALVLPEMKSMAWIVFCLFVLSWCFGGAYHMAWIFLGDAVQDGDEKKLSLMLKRFSQLNPVVFGLLAIPNFLLALLILFGALAISPWYTLFTPIVLMMLMPALRRIDQPVGIWIWGGWTNLVFVIYYGILLLTL